MAFKRAQWHSGLTYQQSCRECKTLVTYTDEILDFRPWFADGFVYCPKCNTPLRHSETYAINAPAAPEAVDMTVEQPIEVQPTVEVPAGEGAAFCAQCGKRFNAGDRFCAGCGTKRN